MIDFLFVSQEAVNFNPFVKVIRGLQKQTLKKEPKIVKLYGAHGGQNDDHKSSFKCVTST